jgi:hypothetical protein
MISGGTMSGNCAIGSWIMAMTPTITMMIEMTIATIGRLIKNRAMELTRIIHECRCEAAETEARRSFSQVRATQAYLWSVEEPEREKPRRARGSAAVVGVHE